MWTDTDGMLSGQFRLTPEIGGQIRVAFEAEVQRIFRTRRAGRDHEPQEAYAADAFATFVLGDDGAGSKVRGQPSTSSSTMVRRCAAARSTAKCARFQVSALSMSRGCVGYSAVRF